MIRSIAIVPQPPLLVPELMGAAAGEADALRWACQQAARVLGGGRWHAVGVDQSGPSKINDGAAGSFRGYGADVRVSLGSRPPAAAEADGLPLPMLLAGWLRGQTGGVGVAGELVHPDSPPGECATRGRDLAGELAEGEWGLLVLADGARTHRAPGAGRVDDRATDFDGIVRDALSAADPAALAALDPGLARELGASGRAAWQLLAAVAVAAHSSWCAELLYSGAPYGVGYHVAVWTPA